MGGGAAAQKPRSAIPPCRFGRRLRGRLARPASTRPKPAAGLGRGAVEPSANGRSTGNGVLVSRAGRNGLADATMTCEGAGAGEPSRSVASSMRSSLPSIGARPTYSSRTRGQAAAVEVERLGGADREVDEAVVDERAAIVDPHDHRLAVAEIGHARIAWQRQRRMRRRVAVHVVGFAVRGQPAVEVRPVPGGDALGAIVRVRVGR